MHVASLVVASNFCTNRRPAFCTESCTKPVGQMGGQSFPNGRRDCKYGRSPKSILLTSFIPIPATSSPNRCEMGTLGHGSPCGRTTFPAPRRESDRLPPCPIHSGPTGRRDPHAGIAGSARRRAPPAVGGGEFASRLRLVDLGLLAPTGDNCCVGRKIRRLPRS
jgi:hypothetical protein